MKSPNKRHAVSLLIVTVCCVSLSVILSGCGEESKPPSEASGYYTGPMKKAGQAGGAGATDPAVTKGGVKTE